MASDSLLCTYFKASNENFLPLRQQKFCGASHIVSSRSEIIRHRFSDMQHRSTTKNLICYKCSSPGHITTDCRNAQKCLLCKGHGHQLQRCSYKAIQIPPSKPPHLPQIHRFKVYSSVLVTKVEISIEGAMAGIQNPN